MLRFPKLNAIVYKTVFSVMVFVLIMITLSMPAFAEMETFEFIMEEEPVFVDEKTASEVVSFYENATTSDLLDPKTNTFVKRSVTIEEGKKPVEKEVVVHTFRLSDISVADPEEISSILQETVEDIFFELTSSLGTKYVSTQVFMYGASYNAEYDPETGEISELLLHVGLVVGDGASQLDSIIQDYVKPNADKWRELPKAQQIVELNKFMLDGRFSYDVTFKQRKSTYEFIKDGKGVCEEYAGLTALFLDELGFENMLIRGYAKSGTELEEHVWNFVKIDGNWYHLDILWNGPVDENGIHTAVNTDYLLKSSSTVKGTHLAYSIYYNYTEHSYYDYDLSPYISPVEPEPEPETEPEPEVVITPEMELKEAREELKATLDAAFDVVFRNSFSYTAESIDKLTPYYTDAKAVYDNTEASVEDVRKQTEILSYAVANYAVAFELADKTSLYKYLSKAYAAIIYDYALYTRDSVEALIEPYDNAVIVYQDVYASQKDVDKAYRDLRKVVKALELLPVQDPEDTASENSGSEDSQGTSGGVVSVHDIPVIPVLPQEQSNGSGLDDPEETDHGHIDEPENTDEPENNDDPLNTGDQTEPVDPGENQDPGTSDNETKNGNESEETVIPDDPATNNGENDGKNTSENNGTENTEDPNGSGDADVPSKNGFSFESLLKSDILIYIIIALLALGGIIYLFVSRNKNESDDEAAPDAGDPKVKSPETAKINPENTKEKAPESNETVPASEEKVSAGDSKEEFEEVVIETNAPETDIGTAKEEETTEGLPETAPENLETTEETVDTLAETVSEEIVNKTDVVDDVPRVTFESAGEQTEEIVENAVSTADSVNESADALLEENKEVMSEAVKEYTETATKTVETDTAEHGNDAGDLTELIRETGDSVPEVKEKAVENAVATLESASEVAEASTEENNGDNNESGLENTETAGGLSGDGDVNVEASAETIGGSVPDALEQFTAGSDDAAKRLEDAIETAKEQGNEVFDKPSDEAVSTEIVEKEEKNNQEKISKLMSFFKSGKSKKG